MRTQCFLKWLQSNKTEETFEHISDSVPSFCCSPLFSPETPLDDDILTLYVGGAAAAMIGKDCIAIACDLRLGSQSLGVANNFEKIFHYDHNFLALTGLATDVTTLSESFRYRTNLYKLREDRPIEPEKFANLVSSMLYEKRFGPYFVSPIVAGIDSTTNKPFVCTFDLIGSIDLAHDFVVSGTATDQLYGMCESLYEPNLEPEDLFETISQAFMNAVDRDAISGWGAVVYLVTKDKVVKRLLKTRQD